MRPCAFGNHLKGGIYFEKYVKCGGKEESVANGKEMSFDRADGSFVHSAFEQRGTRFRGIRVQRRNSGKHRI